MKQRETTGILEKIFHLSKFGTKPKTEVMAGLTTFMTMSYILIVIPQTLGQTGMDQSALFTATILATVVATLIAGLFANMPISLAPGLGLSAYFTYTVVNSMGVPWQTALTAVFVEGIIFILLTLTNVREAIVDAIPLSLRAAISSGIGLFIAFIGLYNAGILEKGSSTPITLGNLLDAEALITIFGIFFIAFFLIKKKSFAMLLGIAVCTVISLIVGLCELPDTFVGLPSSIAPIALSFDLSGVSIVNFIGILFTFLFVDMFDTIGTVMGVAQKANLVDKDGKITSLKRILMSDAVGTTAGAALGVSTVGAYVESASGAAAGGRTGLTSVVTAVCFGAALFFGPILMMVPSAATSPVLVLVGVMMAAPIRNIDFDDYTEAIPCFLTMIMMPLSYSIAEGISFGCISYAVLKLISGKGKECSVVLYILAVAFICKYIFL